LWNEQNNTSGPIGEVAAANIETDKMVISVKNVFRALSDNRPGDLKQRVSEINVSLRVIEGLMTKWPQSKQYLADDVVQVRASVMDFLNGVQQYSLNNPIPESFTWYGKEYYFHNEKILALCNSKTGVIEAVNKFKLNSGIFALPASKEPPMFKSRVAEVYDEQKDRKMPTPEEMMKLIEKRKNETADKGAKSFSTNIKKEEIKAGQTFEMDKLYFDADSTNINPGSTKALDELYDFLVKNPKVTIEVGGHTNNLPPEDYCDLLSEKRAKSVAQYIIKKGISEQRVSFKGYGKRQPIATNETSGGRKRNQRVEVKIIKVE
jgi:outer membrane protein OmpA-like peptidoglycan-associated protein